MAWWRSERVGGKVSGSWTPATEDFNMTEGAGGNWNADSEVYPVREIQREV